MARKFDLSARTSTRATVGRTMRAIIQAVRSRVLAQKDLVAVQILELHAGPPRTRLRLAEECDADMLHALVIAATVGRLDAEERVAACLSAHERSLVGRGGALQRERQIAMPRQRD